MKLPEITSGAVGSPDSAALSRVPPLKSAGVGASRPGGPVNGGEKKDGGWSGEVPASRSKGVVSSFS